MTLVNAEVPGRYPDKSGSSPNFSQRKRRKDLPGTNSIHKGKAFQVSFAVFLNVVEFSHVVLARHTPSRRRRSPFWHFYLNSGIAQDTTTSDRQVDRLETGHSHHLRSLIKTMSLVGVLRAQASSFPPSENGYCQIPLSHFAHQHYVTGHFAGKHNQGLSIARPRMSKNRLAEFC